MGYILCAEPELEFERSLFDKYKYTTCMAKNT